VTLIKSAMVGLANSEDMRRRIQQVLLFRLERLHSPDEHSELDNEVLAWFVRYAGFERLQDLFSELLHKKRAGHLMPRLAADDWSEMRNLVSIVCDIQKTGCLAKGEEIGRPKGTANGKAEALICVLAERFGAVAPSWKKRIHGAEPENVERWLKRAIVAPDLLSVFSPPD
jgi:hypothetical protein